MHACMDVSVCVFVFVCEDGCMFVCVFVSDLIVFVCVCVGG